MVRVGQGATMVHAGMFLVSGPHFGPVCGAAGYRARNNCTYLELLKGIQRLFRARQIAAAEVS